MMEPVDGIWQQMLRQHRHDVLNGLQLISGYLQLGRPEGAHQSLERMAAWLRTISWIQTLSDQSTSHEWFRASHVAPHIVLRQRPEQVTMNEQTDARLAAAWQWLESMASLHGVMEIGIDVMGQDESETAQNVLCVNEVPEMDVWWEERPMLAGVQWTVAR